MAILKRERTRVCAEIAIAAILVLLSMTGCGQPDHSSQIAVTLDDAPLMHRAAYAGSYERALAVDSLIGALTSRGVPATVFAIGQDLETIEDRALLARWAEAGIGIGNHSYSHTSFDDLSLEEGRRELQDTQALILRSVGPEAMRPLFRFPFLEEGESPSKRKTWRTELSERGLSPARVTITTDDWRYDERYTEAELAEQWDERYNVGQEYLQHVLDSVRFWNALAGDLYDRPVKHVLMLHANRINRDYLGAILDALAEGGFEFIPLAEAYADPLYSEDVSWTSTNGMSFLEYIKQDRLEKGTYPAP